MSLVFFVCALLSKGSTVTLPAVLLVLNVYPLRRLGGDAGWWSAPARRVYVELAPFSLLAAAATALTLVALQHVDPLSLGDKITVSVYSLAFYLQKTVWPSGLSPLYGMPADVVATAPRFVFGGVVVSHPRHRVVGGAPANGIAGRGGTLSHRVAAVSRNVQNGPQIAADRYTYFAAPALAILVGAALLRAARSPLA